MVRRTLRRASLHRSSSAMAYGVAPLGPIGTLSAVPCDSTMIPSQLSGFCHPAFAILDRRFPASPMRLARSDSLQPLFPPPMRSTRLLVSGIGRLKPGLTMAQAQARLTAMAAELRHDFPADYPQQAQWTIEIQSLQETLVGNVRPMLLVLLGAVILIVFIVSLNIANLLLARASGRQQEMAVRLALGASPGRM